VRGYTPFYSDIGVGNEIAKYKKWYLDIGAMATLVCAII